jgi:hypothetical protein
METPAPVLAPAAQELAKASPPALPLEVPTDLSERLVFYSNYNLISDLDRFAHFEDIAALEISTENATEIVKEENLPPELVQDPSFFAHYPILQQMDKLQNLEAVLDAPPTEGDSRGQG